MRILMIGDRLTGGGAEKILQILAADLAGRGHRLTVWTFSGSREEGKVCFPPKVRLRRLPFRQEGRLSRALERAAALLPRRWDAILAMKEGPCMRLASRIRAGRKLAWVHTDFESLHWSRHFFRSGEEERACMARFDRVLCVSETVRRSLIAAIGDPGNLCVRLNPIPYDRIGQMAADDPTDAERPPEGPLLLSLGRLDRSKRPALLLDVCRELHREHAFTLWMIGGGEEEKPLRERIRREGLEFVRLLGPRENPYPYLRRADWLVSASESESYGLTVQEALILGVPVLACACPAVREHLDPRFGVLTGLEREALRDGLRMILERPEEREKKRRNIRRYIQKEKLWEPRLSAIRSLIEKGL